MVCITASTSLTFQCFHNVLILRHVNCPVSIGVDDTSIRLTALKLQHDILDSTYETKHRKSGCILDFLDSFRDRVCKKEQEEEASVP